MLGGLAIGALWGAVFGFVAQWSTRGQRDFSSLRNLAAAGHYDLMVATANADSARALLGEERSRP